MDLLVAIALVLLFWVIFKDLFVVAVLAICIYVLFWIVRNNSRNL